LIQYSGCSFCFFACKSTSFDIHHFLNELVIIFSSVERCLKWLNSKNLFTSTFLLSQIEDLFFFFSYKEKCELVKIKTKKKKLMLLFLLFQNGASLVEKITHPFFCVRAFNQPDRLITPYEATRLPRSVHAVQRTLNSKSNQEVEGCQRGRVPSKPNHLH